MQLVLVAFASVEDLRWSVGAEAGQRHQVEEVAQRLVVALGPVVVAGDASGVAWDGYQTGVGAQPT